MFTKYDKPKYINPDTKYRIVGPYEINGLNVWRVHSIIDGGCTGEQIGPDCFSYEQVNELVQDLLKGKISFVFGNTPFKKHNL